MMKTLKVLCFLFLTIQVFSQVEEKFITVADITEYNEAIKKATPGTTIILKNGRWENVHLEAYGKGTKENPIQVKAQKAGKVILTGDSSLKIYGEYVTVDGLWFRDGFPRSKTIINFKKDSKTFANNCRLTNSAITNYNPNYHLFKTHWVSLWGKNNRVDHNNFSGKKNEGTTLVVWLKGAEHVENNHSIDSNFFGPRPDVGSKNAETIRIGTSSYSMASSKTIVENNTFKKCDAELEIISNKSNDNVFRGNLFVECRGSLTLRHGNNAIVENNVFLGNNLPKTGGIRIGNKGHIVRNNLLVNIKGESNRAPISLMNGIPNSPLNGYHQVDNVSIQNNTLINCSTIEFAVNKDGRKTLPPINSLFANNLIGKGNVKVSNSSNGLEGITFKNNFVETTGEANRYLFIKKSIDWSDVKSISIPTAVNKNLISDFNNEKSPEFDIIGDTRDPFVVGAFNLGATKLPKAMTVKTGTNWDTKVVEKKFKGRIVTVEPGEGTLTKAIKEASGKTLLMLRDGHYYVSSENKINENITIQGNKNTILESKTNLEKPFKSFFKVNGNARFEIKNVILNGGVNNIKYGIISPSKGITDKYNLFVENCIFKNFKNTSGGYIIKAYTNTVADTLSIKDSQFIDAYRGIAYHSKENTVLNAHKVIIENSVFKNIDGFAFKYIKPEAVENSGSSSIKNCVFSNVNNKEKGNIVQVKDVAFSEIKNSVFEKSNDIVNTVSLQGANNKISNCLIYNSGEIKTTKGAKKENIISKNPKWKDRENFTPKSKSILLKENNKVANIGLLN